VSEISLEQEIFRLQKVATNLIALNLCSSDLQLKVLDLKRAAMFALSGLKAARGQHWRPWEEVRAMAVKANREKTDKRHAEIMAEITALVAENGEPLSYAAIAKKLNERGRVKPVRSLEWSDTSVRFIMRRAAKAASAADSQH